MGLLLSAILFVGLHFLLSHPLRRPLVRALGEGPFRGIYSLLALVTFAAMIYFYRKCGREPPLWDAAQTGWIAGTLLMWLAAILFVGSFIGNPALVAARGPRAGPRGVLAITRHPMMWSFAIWAAVHLSLLAMPKAIVFDGAIILLALAGAAAQDRKKSSMMGEAWHEWTTQTAFV
ncbi:MAG: NnrU family protein, partial [Sphingomicrobium sp.]